MLEIKNIYKTFNKGTVNEKKALNGVSFTLNDGDFVTVIGGNGAGKSTTLNAVAGVWPVDSGSIIIDGINVTGLPEHKRAKYLGRVFQDPMTSLNPTITVGKQIGEAVRIHNKKMSRGQIRKRVIELMQLVEIDRPEERIRQYPHEFSGGMRQRAVMAIALAGDPKILFADEPTTALDVTIQAQILDVFRRIQKKMEMATVFISHDLGVVAGVADRVAVMYAGKIVEIGTAEEIFYDPRHPYTWGLLQSLPILAGEKEWLPTLPGMPPTLIHPPKGDAFAERNVYAMRIDYEKEPPMFRITDTHYAATWLLDERAPKVKVPIGGRRYGK